MTPMKTFVDEMVFNFIIGDEPIEGAAKKRA
jgi:hypothetical protein